MTNINIENKSPAPPNIKTIKLSRFLFPEKNDLDAKRTENITKTLIKAPLLPKDINSNVNIIIATTLLIFLVNLYKRAKQKKSK